MSRAAKGAAIITGVGPEVVASCQPGTHAGALDGQEHGIARQLSELSREMQADLTVDALLERIVAAAAAEVPGAQHAGITLLTGKHLSTPVAAGELVARIDRVRPPHFRDHRH
jgi:hypothetical protein